MLSRQKVRNPGENALRSAHVMIDASRKRAIARERAEDAALDSRMRREIVLAFERW